MFIKSISLENIRSYKKETITFATGSTLLWGEIGSGKSTILYTIEFALFGIIKGINSYAQLLRHGEQEGKVSLSLQMKKNPQQDSVETYVIERQIKKSSKGKFSSSASIIINGRKKELSTSELRHFIHELLGYPTEDVSRKFMLFRYSVYTPQEEMKQILLDDPESRIATLRKIFDLDKYKHIKDNVQFYARYIKEQISYNQAKAEGLLEKRRLLEENQKRREDNEKQRTTLQVNREKEEKALAQAQEKLQNAEEKFEKRTSLMNTKASLTSVLETKQKNHDELQETKKKERLSLQRHVTSIVQESKTVVLRCQECESAGIDSSAYLSRLNQAIESCKRFLSDKEGADVSAPEQISSYTSLQDTLQRLIDVLEEIQTTLSERKRIVQETQKTREAKREQKREELTQKENEITRAQSSIKALNDAIEKNTKRYEKEVSSELVSRQEDELTALRKEIAEKQKTLEERGRKREALTKSIQTYDYKKETAQNTIRKITELSSCPTCLQTVTDEYKRDVLSVQKELIENAQRVLTELSESKQTLQSEENTLKEEIERMQKKQLTLHTTYEQNKKTLAENKKLAQEIQSDRERIVALNRSLESHKAERDKLKQMQDETYKKERDAYDQSIRYIERAFQQVQNTIYTVKETLTLLRNIQERATSAESVSKEIADVKERIVKIEQSISELAIDSDAIRQYRDEVEAIKERVNSITVQLAELQKDKSYIDEQMQTIQKEIDEKSKAKEEFDFLSSLHSWLTDYFTKLTDVIERHVFLTIYQEFNESFRKWFEILMDSEEITVQLDSQFTPLVSINGYDAEYQHLSGGEKTAIALSYRIALNEILHRTYSGIKTRDLIILDEPTDGFSYQQIDRIQDLLDRIHCTQTIVVSHETKIESYVDTIIRVQKENHVSHVIQ